MPHVLTCCIRFLDDESERFSHMMHFVRVGCLLVQNEVAHESDVSLEMGNVVLLHFYIKD